MAVHNRQLNLSCHKIQAREAICASLQQVPQRDPGDTPVIQPSPQGGKTIQFKRNCKQAITFRITIFRLYFEFWLSKVYEMNVGHCMESVRGMRGMYGSLYRCTVLCTTA